MQSHQTDEVGLVQRKSLNLSPVKERRRLLLDFLEAILTPGHHLYGRYQTPHKLFHSPFVPEESRQTFCLL